MFVQVFQKLKQTGISIDTSCNTDAFNGMQDITSFRIVSISDKQVCQHVLQDLVTKNISIKEINAQLCPAANAPVLSISIPSVQHLRLSQVKSEDVLQMIKNYAHVTGVTLQIYEHAIVSRELRKLIAASRIKNLTLSQAGNITDPIGLSKSLWVEYIQLSDLQSDNDELLDDALQAPYLKRYAKLNYC